MENPITIDDFGGKPTIFGNIHMFHIFSINFMGSTPAGGNWGAAVGASKLGEVGAMKIYVYIFYI